ncbi:MAG: FAD-dependent oxidoreductase [Promethearchaeota archaeon]
MRKNENGLKLENINQINCDIAVVGGGLAGTFAAIAAKRIDKKLNVWLIERYGFLGGMATAGYVYPFMRYYTKAGNGKGKYKRLIGGLFKEMMDEMKKRNYCEKIAPGFQFYSRFDPMLLRCVLDDMVLKEGINVLYHTLVNKVSIEILGKNNSQNTSQGQNTSQSQNDTIDDIIIKGLYAQTKIGQIEIKPKFVIDATGDADIIYHAGGEFKYGREDDGLVQPATLNFRLHNIGFLFIKPSRRFITRKIIKYKEKGYKLTPRDDCLAFTTPNSGELHFNQTRVSGFNFLDPFDMTKAEIEGRKQAENFIRFLRKHIIGFKKSAVSAFGTQLGIRESRRIVGEYILNENDLLSCVLFEDRIAIGNYPIDIHDPMGSAQTEIKRIPEGKFYSIPFRSLVPKGIRNMLIAGRPISATHRAHSAIRVMPICSAIGHAAGIAAALFCKKFKQISNKEEIDIRKIPINQIQHLLRQQGAILE